MARISAKERKLAETLADGGDPYLPEVWAMAEGLMALPFDRFSFSLRKRALAALAESK